MRKATLMKTNLPPEQKERSSEVLTKNFMSSESSGEEEMEDGSVKPVMAIKPLPWRSQKALRLFKRLDSRAKINQSKQSAQQTLARVVGVQSSRPKPTMFPNDFWGFKTD